MGGPILLGWHGLQINGNDLPCVIGDNKIHLLSLLPPFLFVLMIPLIRRLSDDL